jgi:tricarballylate dehydrogenase
MTRDNGSVDVLIAGGGNAALCAAITAREAGRSVLLVEAATRFYRGGNTRHTRNMRIAHDQANAVLTGPYLESEYWDDLLRVTSGDTDEPLARLTLSRSKELWDWLTQRGVRFQKPLGGTLGLGRTNAFFLGGGRAMLNALYRHAEKLGVAIRYEAEIVDVAIANGFFTGATIRTTSGDEHILARALIAASGGFESNLEWLEESWGPPARNFLIRGTRHNRGALLKLLARDGIALTGDPKQCHAVAIDARSPRFDGGIVTRLDCVVFGIVVNRDAQRFYDEGEDVWPKRYAVWGRLVADQPDQIAWILFDAKSARAFMPSVYPAIEAATIGELAVKLGLNPHRLEETVRRFNAAVRDGSFDPDRLDDCRTEGVTPPKSHWARRLDTPPFGAYPVRPGITFTYLATKVDANARAVMHDGRPSANIFAAGEIMAGNILGRGYLAGIGMTIGSVFGRIAGAEAARHVAN